MGRVLFAYMNIQKKYLLTYGHNVQLSTLEVWAFSVKQAIEFGELMRTADAVKAELTKVEQIV